MTGWTLGRWRKRIPTRKYRTIPILYLAAISLIIVHAGYLHDRASRIICFWNAVDGFLAVDTSDVQTQLPIIVQLHQQRQQQLILKRQRKQESNSNIVVSACLLIKDDNEILGEWLAYHYFALNLRNLIVAVDPQSYTSPDFILNRWNATSFMNIHVWSDQDYMPRSFLETGYHIPPEQINGNANASKYHRGDESPEQVVADLLKIENHRFRQVTFLSACLNHFKAQNQSWVLHIDTDEYVTVNPLLRTTRNNNHHQNHNLTNNNDKNEKHQSSNKQLSIVSPSQPSSVHHVLEQILGNPQLRVQTKYPCISMPRLLFGSIEQAEIDANTSSRNTSMQQQQQRGDGFDRNRFETIRWKYHAQYNDTERNAQPKCIVDVSHVPSKDRIFHNPFSIHRPSNALCSGIRNIHIHETDRFPFIVHHYIGSRDRYFRKNDTRRTESMYRAKAHVQDGYDDWITPWLDGFVDHVGIDTATTLLPEYIVGTRR